MRSGALICINELEFVERVEIWYAYASCPARSDYNGPGMSKWALRCCNGAHPRADLIWGAASFDLAALTLSRPSSRRSALHLVFCKWLINLVQLRAFQCCLVLIWTWTHAGRARRLHPSCAAHRVIKNKYLPSPTWIKRTSKYRRNRKRPGSFMI